MGVAVAVAPLTKMAASAPTVAQSTSTNTISEGVGGRDPNADGNPHRQDGGEPAAPDNQNLRDMTQ